MSPRKASITRPSHSYSCLPRATTEWRMVTIGEIAEVVGGSTPSTKEPSYFDGGIPWLTPKDLSSHHHRYISRGGRNLSQAGLDSCSAKLVPPGSVLLSTRAPIGYVAIAHNPIATNQGFRNTHRQGRRPGKPRVPLLLAKGEYSRTRATRLRVHLQGTIWHVPQVHPSVVASPIRTEGNRQISQCARRQDRVGHTDRQDS